MLASTLVAFLSLAALPPQADVASAQRPNILIIFSDDHATQAIGTYGSVINRTPSIDRIGKEGAVFMESFCTNSICAPSRAVILTGLHSHANGVLTNAESFDGSQRTFPKLLQAAGYETALVGKWHLKSDPTGFDHWRVLPGQGHYYNPDFRTPEGTTRHAGYVTDLITDFTIDWLRERDGERPFLMMCQHKAPHRSWMPGPDELGLFDQLTIAEPPSLFDDWTGRASGAAETEMTIARHFLGRYDLKLDQPAFLEASWELAPRERMNTAQRAAWDAAYGAENAAFVAALEAGELDERALVSWKYQRYVKDYLRCVAGVDKSVGRLLAYLEASGLAANTIVVYGSDQGFYLGEHGWYDKRWMYEESMRMPLIVRWPGVTRPGARPQALVQNIDWAPTFLEAAGVDIPPGLHGRSLVPLLRGETPKDWRTSLYYRYAEFPRPHRVPPHYGVRTSRYKLIRYPATDEWELFDLERDSRELESRHADPAYAERRAELEAELTRLRALYGDAG